MADKKPDQATVAPLIVEPRFKRVMPWILVVCALTVGIYAAQIRTNTTTASKTTVQTGTGPIKTTTVAKGPSDQFTDVLFGLAAILVLSGAFYSRITKISLPGGAGLELSAAAIAIDQEKLAQSVAEQLKKELEKKPEGERPDTEQVALLAARATADAQRQALQIRIGLTSAASSSAPAVEVKDVEGARRGMPLSDDLVRRLAESAVETTLKTA